MDPIAEKEPLLSSTEEKKITVERLVKHFGANPHKRTELEAVCNQLNSQAEALEEFRQLQLAIERSQKEEKAEEFQQMKGRGRDLLKELLPEDKYDAVFSEQPGAATLTPQQPVFVEPTK